MTEAEVIAIEVRGNRLCELIDGGAALPGFAPPLPDLFAAVDN